MINTYGCGVVMEWTHWEMSSGRRKCPWSGRTGSELGLAVVVLL
jgi:hypothetical protein